MSKLIPVNGRQLQQSELNPATVTYTVTAVDVPAARTFGHKNALLREKIHLECTCSGNFDESGNLTFAGTGRADINASGSVHCEGKPLLREGAQVTIKCNGLVTNTSSGATSSATASVTITLIDANQNNIFAGER